MNFQSSRNICCTGFPRYSREISSAILDRENWICQKVHFWPILPIWKDKNSSNNEYYLYYIVVKCGFSHSSRIQIIKKHFFCVDKQSIPVGDFCYHFQLPFSTLCEEKVSYYKLQENYFSFFCKIRNCQFFENLFSKSSWEICLSYHFFKLVHYMARYPGVNLTKLFFFVNEEFFRFLLLN